VDYFPMRSAHGPQSVTVGQEFGDLRINGAFVVAFMCDDPLLDDFIGL
jgi:hypothetical protein